MEGGVIVYHFHNYQDQEFSLVECGFLLYWECYALTFLGTHYVFLFNHCTFFLERFGIWSYKIFSVLIPNYKAYYFVFILLFVLKVRLIYMHS